jgi:hypothetical protein
VGIHPGRSLVRTKGIHNQLGHQLAQSVEVVEHGGMRRVPKVDLESSAATDSRRAQWLFGLPSDPRR